MVTSSAVVGSSAMINLGLAGNGHGNHHPLPHPAAHLMRVIFDSLRRERDAHLFEEFRRLVECVLVRDPVMAFSTSAIWSPTRKTGLRELIGS